jgi:hypothetical protein
VKVRVSATIENLLFIKMKTILYRLNEKNHKKFIKQSHFLDNAISFYGKIDKQEDRERIEVTGCSFTILKKHRDLLDSFSFSGNRSVLISHIIDEELTIYEKIENELLSAIVGYDENFYYVPKETLEQLDDCLSLGELKIVVLHGKTLVREEYSRLFNSLYLGYRKCEKKGKEKSV